MFQSENLVPGQYSRPGPQWQMIRHSPSCSWSAQPAQPAQLTSCLKLWSSSQCCPQVKTHSLCKLGPFWWEAAEMNHFLFPGWRQKKIIIWENNKSGTEASNDCKTIGWSCYSGVVLWQGHPSYMDIFYWLIRYNSPKSFPKSKRTSLSSWASSLLWRGKLFRGNSPSPQLSTWKYFLPILMHSKVLIRRGEFDGPEWYIAIII